VVDHGRVLFIKLEAHLRGQISNCITQIGASSNENVATTIDKVGNFGNADAAAKL